MVAMASAGFFTVRKLPWTKTAPVACAYASFIVFNNLSIKVNTGEEGFKVAATCFTVRVVPWPLV
jgi:hypothetical protein